MAGFAFAGIVRVEQIPAGGPGRAEGNRAVAGGGTQQPRKAGGVADDGAGIARKEGEGAGGDNKGVIT